MDYANESLQSSVYTSSAATPGSAGVPFSARGTHFAFKAVTTGSTAATLASLIFHFNKEDSSI